MIFFDHTIDDRSNLFNAPDAYLKRPSRNETKGIFYDKF